MKAKLLHIIRHKPLFLFLLPPFFVLHGVLENYNHIPAKDALLLTAVYLGAALVLAGLCWLLFRNFTKANLAALYLVAFNFFFGSLHDGLKNIFPGSFFSKYIFILPLALLGFIGLLVWLKKTRHSLQKTTYYLNSLLLLLIALDAVLLTGKVIRKQTNSSGLPTGFSPCETCPRPDIYFILADEYAGNTELKDLFGFDNSAFLRQLDSLGFRVIPESRSNYNYTPFSVASILHMDYLELGGTDRAQPDLTYSYEAIRDNNLLRFLQAQGYQFYNYSVFDFEGQPARVRETFLPVRTRLITAQTFLKRFDKEIRFNFVYRWKSRRNQEILTYANRDNNKNIYDLTWKLPEQPGTRPKFVYAHLMLPHYPYYYDKDGRERPFDSLQEGNQVDKAAYAGYLQYANTKLLALVTQILQKSTQPPVIVLMGDHGFRHFKEPVEKKYYFLNLASVHLPGRVYTGFNDSMTGVNLFRSILNTQFRQQLPLLKDSSIYLRD